ncbi:nucleotide exchange factor GrpE [Desulfogranum mediterraneum]|uniref:nucleotide exchange factor GrpE n=1 Tax=Desulfogranum mediterraneum TaxID=160661 RepID=UPI00041AB371|nr:nucleotide exchange factor GrpE [Desulfogranum mediterraneum]
MVEETREQQPVDQEEATTPDELGDVEGVVVEEADEVDSTHLQEELGAAQDKLLRIAAEFENFKKRMEREQAKLIKYAGENILRELLTTLDNLDRAIEQGKAGNGEDSAKLQSMLEGLDLTQKGLAATLEKFGVEPLESVGKEFNPDEQDALTMEASDEVPANHVLREFAKGYQFKDRVLRHAQVVVSSGPA